MYLPLGLKWSDGDDVGRADMIVVASEVRDPCIRWGCGSIGCNIVYYESETTI
jgi:hypothetical protein